MDDDSSSRPVTIPESFTVSVGFVGDDAVVRVGGELDLLTAPTLASLVAATVRDPRRDVVLDLTAATFVGAHALRIIDEAARSLAAGGHTLTLRGASPTLRRVLHASGVARRVRLEERALVLPPGDVVRAITLPADDDVVDRSLRLVVALARATVPGAHGVSVSLLRHGALSTVAATDRTVLSMDEGQYSTSEGPCLDAAAQGVATYTASLDGETRWPAFTPRAKDLGIRAILSSPLVARRRPVGALNIYSRRSSAFDPAARSLAGVFATEASGVLTAAGADVTDRERESRARDALRARTLIAQALGVVMQRDGVGDARAYRTLREEARAGARPVLEQAVRLVAVAQRPARRGDGVGGR